MSGKKSCDKRVSTLVLNQSKFILWQFWRQILDSRCWQASLLPSECSERGTLPVGDVMNPQKPIGWMNSLSTSLLSFSAWWLPVLLGFLHCGCIAPTFTPSSPSLLKMTGGFGLPCSLRMISHGNSPLYYICKGSLNGWARQQNKSLRSSFQWLILIVNYIGFRATSVAYFWGWMWGCF